MLRPVKTVRGPGCGQRIERVLPCPHCDPRPFAEASHRIDRRLEAVRAAKARCFAAGIWPDLTEEQLDAALGETGGAS